jgi:hypothetical protein
MRIGDSNSSEHFDECQVHTMEDSVTTTGEPETRPLRTRVQRRDAARELLIADPSRGDREVARAVASDHHSVARWRKALQQEGLIPVPGIRAPRLPEPESEQFESEPDEAYVPPIVSSPRGYRPAPRRNERADLRKLIEAHTKRSRTCGCRRHFRDGFPEVCESGWRELDSDPAKQLAIAELRSGIYRLESLELLFDSPGAAKAALEAAGAIASVAAPRRYRDDPLDDPRWLAN